MHDIYKSNICKLVTQHIPHVQGELLILQEHLIWFTVFNGVGVVFLCFLSFVVFVSRLLSLSLVCCLCLSFVVVVVSFIFLPSVFFKVCFFIMSLNPLSVFDHMTISMDISMYRKHNMICLYRTELFQKNITTLRNCSFLMGYFNPSKSICTSFRSVFL